MADLSAWAEKRSDPNLAEALRRLRDLPPTHGGLVAVPWGHVDRAEFNAGHEGFKITPAIEDAPVEEVPIAELVGPQRSVNPGRVAKYIRDSNIPPPGSRAPGGWFVDLPIVVKQNGQLTTYDGNHRLTAQWLLGQKTARARVITVPPR